MTATPWSTVALDRSESRSARLDQERRGPHEHPETCWCRECIADEARGER